MMKSTLIRPLVLLLATGMVFGCATQPAPQPQATASAELSSLRALAEKAAADAAAAKASATNANATAAEAKSAADAAMSTAESARRQSAETEAKIDRMFKKAMYK